MGHFLFEVIPVYRWQVLALCGTLLASGVATGALTFMVCELVDRINSAGIK